MTKSTLLSLSTVLKMLRKFTKNAGRLKLLSEPLKIKKHKHLAKSLFQYGLQKLQISCLARSPNVNINLFNFLSCNKN
jgi:hypothetical protein